MKRLLSILFIIMLIITFVQIRNAYALYKDKLTGEYASDIGKWSVKVNGTEIAKKDGQITKFEMSQDDISYIETEYLAGSGFAPGSEGYFYINVDSTESDVAVKYNIHLGEIAQYRIYPENYDSSIDEIPNAQDFTTPFTVKVEGVEDTFYDNSGNLTGDNFKSKNKVEENTNTVKGILPLNQLTNKGCKDKIKVSFKWINEDENTSLEDALINNNRKQDQIHNIKLIIPVHVKLIQYLGEEL